MRQAEKQEKVSLKQTNVVQKLKAILKKKRTASGKSIWFSLILFTIFAGL